MKKVYLFKENSNYKDFDICIKDINIVKEFKDICLIVNTVYDLINYTEDVVKLTNYISELIILDCNRNFKIDGGFGETYFNMWAVQIQFIKDTKKEAHIATMPDYSKKKPMRMRIIKHK